MRANATGVWAIALAVLCLALLAQPAAADQSRIDVAVELSSDLRVSASGTLGDATGQPIDRARVEARIGGRVLAAAETRSSGEFTIRFDVPPDLRDGERRLTFRFDGSSDHSPAEAVFLLAMQGSAGATPAATAPATTASARPAPPRLTAQSDVASPINGSVVQLSGRLATADDAGIVGAGIRFSTPTGEATDSYTVTSGDGRFATYFEVPLDHEGPLPVGVEFPGGGGHAAVSATVQLDVRALQSSSPTPSPTPDPQPGTAVPSAASEPETTTTPDLAAGADGIASTSSAAPPDTAEEEIDSSMRAWVFGGMIAAGGASAVVAVIAMTVLRRGRARDDAHAEDGFDLFADLD